MRLIELTWLMIKREMVIKYRGTILGYIWTILSPLAFACVYYIAFKYIVRIPVENYAVFLLTGLFPWIWISSTLNNATNAFTSYQAVLKSRYINPLIVPFFVVTIEFVNFLFSIPVIIALLIYTGTNFNLSSVIHFPILIILHFVFLISASGIIACLSLIFRDLGHLIQLAIQMLFFLSPIIYPLSLVPVNYINIYKLNPFVNMIQLWRQIFNGENVDLILYAYPLIFSIFIGIISYILLNIIGKKAVQWL